MKISSLKKSLLAFFLVAASIVSGCLQGSEQNENTPSPSQTGAPARERVTGTRGGTITYRATQPPKTLNALMFSDEPSFTTAFILMGARLIDFDHDAQRYVPALAEVWQLGDDRRTLDLTLRDGLKFSDGHALTTEDVAFTLRAVYDERTGSILQSAETIGGKPIDFKVVDARRMQLVFPDAVAVPETYLINMVVLPRHVLEEDLKKGTLGREAYAITSDPARIVVAGPFMVESVTPGERVTLKRNPNYWKKDAAGNQLPYLDGIVVETVSDPNAAVARLNQNTLDIADRVRASDYAALQNRQGAVRAYDLGPGLSTDQMWFNLNEGGQGGKPYVDPVKRAWFADARFRRAVAHAVDRDSITSSTLQGLATPLYGFVSPGNRAWLAPDVPRAEFNLERARNLLQEAGFQLRGSTDAPELFDAGGRRVEFTLIVPASSEERKAMAAVVQEDLARLGIRMQIAPVETSEVLARTQQSFDYDAALLGLVITDFDPSSYSNFLNSSTKDHQWHPKQSKPATEWEARIDELVATLSREPDVERRRAVFRDIQVIFAEQMPIIPIVVRHIVSAANTRVGNYRPSIVIPYSMWNAEELFVKKQ